jgi:glycosyltransferase involved in cell wall biosynthesis
VNNPKSIADKLEYVLDYKNKEEVERVKTNALKMVKEKYNWDIISINMNNIFNKLLS